MIATPAPEPPVIRSIPTLLVIAVLATPAGAQDSTATKPAAAKPPAGFWISGMSGVGTLNNLTGPGMHFQRGQWITSIGLLMAGHLNPLRYKGEAMPTHEERVATTIEVGKFMRRGMFDFRAQIGIAGYQRMQVRDSLTQDVIDGRQVTVHHVRSRADVSGTSISLNGGVDVRLSRFFYLGAEARATGGPSAVLAGVGVVLGVGVRP